MIIVVTGSAGFIGKSLCRRLVSLGHKVIGIDKNLREQERFYSEFLVDGYMSMVKDLRGSSWMNDWLGWTNFFGEPDLCFHLAALTSVDECEESRYEAYTNNVMATYQVVEQCRKRKIPLIYASSVSIYGDKRGQTTVETSAPIPPTYYATTKYIGELLVRTLPKYTILRFGTTYGPEMRPVVAPYVFLKAAFNGEDIPIQGTGKQTRCFVYIDDVINGCIYAMNESKKSTIGTVNLAGSKPESILKLAGVCWDAANKHKQMWTKHLPPRKNDTLYENICIDKAEQRLGWTPDTDLEHGIKKVYKAWKRRKV